MRQAEKMRGRLPHPAPASVTLSGGPMNGWVVKPDAPVLRPDWQAPPEPSRSFLSRLAGRPTSSAQGRYVVDATGIRATWQLGEA